MRTFTALALVLALAACGDDTTPLADLGPADASSIDALQPDGPLPDSVAPDGPLPDSVAPDGPAASDALFTPDGPSTSDAPFTPDGPSTSDAPSTPDAPFTPDGPWVPDMFVIPDGPLSDATKPQVCQSLSLQYAATLKLAKACSAMLPVIQCTLEVNDELACPCTTYVNPQNTQAVQQLTALQQAWTALGCHIGIACPAVVCPVPSWAQCQASSGNPVGSCVDVFGP